MLTFHRLYTFRGLETPNVRPSLILTSVNLPQMTLGTGRQSIVERNRSFNLTKSKWPLACITSAYLPLNIHTIGTSQQSKAFHYWDVDI